LACRLTYTKREAVKAQQRCEKNKALAEWQEFIEAALGLEWRLTL
jgi:hypothetical protein